MFEFLQFYHFLKIRSIQNGSLPEKPIVDNCTLERLRRSYNSTANYLKSSTIKFVNIDDIKGKQE